MNWGPLWPQISNKNLGRMLKHNETESITTIAQEKEKSSTLISDLRLL